MLWLYVVVGRRCLRCKGWACVKFSSTVVRVSVCGCAGVRWTRYFQCAVLGPCAASLIQATNDQRQAHRGAVQCLLLFSRCVTDCFSVQLKSEATMQGHHAPQLSVTRSLPGKCVCIMLGCTAIRARDGTRDGNSNSLCFPALFSYAAMMRIKSGSSRAQVRHA